MPTRVAKPTSLPALRLAKLRQLRALQAEKDRLDREEALAKARRDREAALAQLTAPGQLAVKLDPATVSTPALELLDSNLIDVAGGRCERLIWSMPPQEGKLVADSTPVPTPTGWITHGQLRVGDYVIHPSGNPVRVTDVHRSATASLMVHTSDHGSVAVHPEHEWTVYDRATGSWRTVETQYLAERKLRHGPKGRRGSKYRFHLPLREALTLPDARLPVDPYTLGVWLGDGSSTTPAVTHHPDDEYVLAYPQSAQCVHPQTGIITTYYRGGFLSDLRSAGVVGNKHIPAVYLRGSEKQRRALLAGLIDTDGHVAKSGQVSFDNANERLVRDVGELLRTLGYRAHVHHPTPPKPSSSGIQGIQPMWRVTYTPHDEGPARLPRKSAVKLGTRRRVAITAITECEPMPGRCITVDSFDGLYLVGEHFTPTHNSQRVSRCFALWLLIRDPDKRIAIASYELGVARRWGRRVRNDITEHPELGLRVRGDTSAAHEWELDGARGGVYTVGIGGPLTGRPVDCVSGDTAIITRNGPVAAAQLAEMAQRPEVLSWDHSVGCAEWRRVQATRVLPGGEVIEVRTVSGRALRCTADHRVYVPARGYVAAGELRPGDRLVVAPAVSREQSSVPAIRVTGTGDAVSVVRRVRDQLVTVYDFQVEGNRNFFAGEVLVHNCLIIDDPVKGRAEADSETYREACWEWWTETARTRLAPSAPVVLIMTRWHKDDLAGRLLNNDDDNQWRVIKVPAQCEEPDTDPLGRELDEYLTSARGRTVEQWRQTRKDVGERGWTALYQGSPSPTEGNMLKRAWWRFAEAPVAYGKPDGSMHVHGMDAVIQSWDMSFKDTKDASFVVGQVWAKRGAEAHLLDQVRDRMDFPTTCRAVEALSAKWPQASLKLIEDKANGTAVIASLRQRVGGLVPITPKESKEARAAAIAPFVEAGNVYLPPPQQAPWVEAYLEECAAFPNGVNDDQVDATSQALTRLLLAGSATEFLQQLTAQQPA